ncbi:formate dehydrogenase accessory sulfurtransferase FdhD [Desulfosporosinus nitroreducens]|uniref:Sulfur carrier protein FdhD n=1 Tax=Desulfosporosinus nitroreducens TaxID=2018668 RepID=A0ABT8QQQ1_9FIRM|nr:formate dehydrogenase accessory sulfurtransferase FdhD [Desulfosporosinus nitroreducens]MCO1602618.1 formate dehydrogenase accessory sulfurtransferase FdhD [Desulfosporosinus nitroreducens]MDO0823674.1 formate dehydrogenase accessory sulfurtransferase FdhD [Desulfosporosinus nitroreducens]
MQEEIGILDIQGVAADIVCDRFSDEGWVRTKVYVPREMELTICVNEKAMVTILCTAAKLNYLVIGYLYAEGIISGLGDVASMRVSLEESLADVRLSNLDYELPTWRKLGCSGSSVFKTQGQKVDSDLISTPMEVLSLMKQLEEQMELYPLSGGVHTSALSDTKNLLVVAEDIGRHNTLNKIQGECLLRGISPRDRLMLSTGRISSEMLLKAAKMQAPIVVSRHAPTKSAILLASDLGIALVGHARGSRLVVYSHPERLSCLSN